MTEIKEIKIAIIDLNNGKENQGLKSLQHVIQEFSQKHLIQFKVDVFELRNKGLIPNLNYHIYFSTGGPGSPFEGKGKKWEMDFFQLLDDLDAHNQNNKLKKHSFLICHSFQLACIKYKIGRITQRDSTAFGIYPINLTTEGEKEPVFRGLESRFYSVDSRNWQVGQFQSTPSTKKFNLLALESDLLNLGPDKCMMAIRFSEEMIGTQFHPEADPKGIEQYLCRPDLKKLVIENHGVEVYNEMILQVHDENKLWKSKNTIIPNFLGDAVNHILKFCK